MEHMIMKVATTSTDTELGQFEALVSAWEADREKDTIARSAFDRSIKSWQESGKNLPLLMEHENEVVGFIDPAAMVTTEDGLVVRGEIDRDSPKGPAAWRMIKSGVAGFSIGFMSKSQANSVGGQHITEIDLLEISVTAKPCHPASRTLAWKSAADSAWPPSEPTLKPWPSLEEFSRQEARKAIQVEAERKSKPIELATFDVELR
jgi:HK97 family phage prohead protease